MSDEIIKTVNELVKILDQCLLGDEITLSINRMKQLLDYITNLQEENERLKVELENKLTPDELVSMLNQELVRQNKNYKSRNEKAIEKLESIRAFSLRSGKTLFSTLINETIDILNGNDK